MVHHENTDGKDNKRFTPNESNTPDVIVSLLLR